MNEKDDYRTLYKRVKGNNGIMTKEEFLKLDYGNMVTCKRYPGEIYEIDDTDVFGVGDRDPIFRVFGAKDRTNNKILDFEGIFEKWILNFIQIISLRAISRRP